MERLTIGAENYGIALKLCKFKISMEKMVTMSRCIINEHLQKLLVSYFHVSVFASALGYRCIPSLLFNIIFYLMNIGSM